MKKTIIYIALILTWQMVHSEVLIIQRIQQEQSFDKPQKGLSMQQVINQYGQPVMKKPAVGEPPITVWKYGNFTVYFEHQWVIDSVINKVNSNEIGPKHVSQ
jgi:hypothetical protein